MTCFNTTCDFIFLQRGRHMWARGCVLWSFLSSTPSSSPVLQSGLTAHQAGEACLSILKTLIWKQKDLLVLFFLSCFYWSSNKSRPCSSHGSSVWFLNLWDSDFCFSKVEWNARCSVWAAYSFFSPSTFILSLQVHHPNANSFTPWTDFLFPLWNHLFLLW